MSYSAAVAAASSSSSSSSSINNTTASSATDQPCERRHSMRQSTFNLSQDPVHINRRLNYRLRNAAAAQLPRVPCSRALCDKSFLNEYEMNRHRDSNSCRFADVNMAVPVDEVAAASSSSSSSPPPHMHQDADGDGMIGGYDDRHMSDSSDISSRSSSPLHRSRSPSPPLPSPPSPRPAIDAPQRLPAILEYMNNFSVALQGRHRLTAAAMNEILAHQAQMVPMLLVAGIGAELRVRNADGSYSSYSGPTPLPAIRRVDVPRPVDSLMKPVRSNAAGPAPWTIHTCTNDGDREEVPPKEEKKRTPSTIYEPKNQRKLMVDVAQLVGVNRDQFTEYVLCPDPECGALYERTIAERIQTCTRYAAIHLEQPIERIKSNIAWLNNVHDEHWKDHHGGLPDLNPGEHYVESVLAHYRTCCDDDRCVHRCIIEPTRAECAKGVCEHMRAHKYVKRAHVCEKHHHQIQQCGRPLFDNRLTNEALLPYPYLGVIGPLTKMLSREGFEDKCELWRKRYNPVTHRRLQWRILADIYDGQLWQDYQFIHRSTKKPITDADIKYHERVWKVKKDGPVSNRPANEGDIYHRSSSIPLLARGGTLALAINVDWYQPFDTSNFSMGAIYLTVLNLPREERYLTENMILVGVLPGPKSSSREQLQGALRPLMAELNKLFGDGKGTKLATFNHPATTNVTAFLHSVICDSPAARMMSGGMNHSGNVGCPYCLAGGTGGSGGTFTNCSGIAPHHGKKQKGSHWGPATIGHKEQWDVPMYRRTDATNRRSALEWSTAKYVGSKLSCDSVPIAAVGGEVLPKVRRINIDPRNQVDEDEACDDNELGAAVADNGDEEDEEEDEDDLEFDPDGSFDITKLCKQLSNQQAAGRKRYASLRGQRYCALMDLPYFDMRRGIPIDVMHNIYLGLCKEMMVLLSKHDENRNPHPVLGQAQLDELQAFMERCHCPSDIGAIPGKIAASMSKFKSAEWMNWMTIFCVPAMRHLFVAKKSKQLTEQHIELLSHMQRLSRLMQSNVITVNEVEEVDRLLVQVIDRVEQIWPSGTKAEKLEMAEQKAAALEAALKAAAIAEGRPWEDSDEDEGDVSTSKKRKNATVAPISKAKKKKSKSNSGAASSSSSSRPACVMRTVSEHVKPNLHYAQHLAEQILDFGPPVNWWCNSYERFNGLLAGVPRTPQHIEVCTMRRHLLMYEIAQRANEKIGTAKRIVDAAPFTPGDDHYKAISKMVSGSSTDVVVDPTGETTKVRTTASNRVIVEYAFGQGMERIRNYVKFTEQRTHLLPGQYVALPPPLSTPIALPIYKIKHSFINVRGDERYPGMLTGRPQSHDLVDPAAFDATPAGNAGMLHRTARSRLSRAIRLRHDAVPLATKPISAETITECLLIHYCTVYDITKQNVAAVAAATAAAAVVADADVAVAAVAAAHDWFAPQVANADFVWHNDKRWDFAESDGRQKMDLKIPYLQKQFLYRIDSEFEVYTSLSMAGETYGSVLADICSTNSYVVINCRVHVLQYGKGWYGAERTKWPRSKGLISQPYYARIQYFIRHSFMGRYHDFAVVRWHATVLEKTARRHFGFKRALRSGLNVDDEERFPWVKASTSDIDEYMLIPVQRILHRWIPMVMPKYWQVCPMQTKVHA